LPFEFLKSRDLLIESAKLLFGVSDNGLSRNATRCLLWRLLPLNWHRLTAFNSRRNVAGAVRSPCVLALAAPIAQS